MNSTKFLAYFQYLFVILLWCHHVTAQSLPAKQAYTLNVKQIHSGHSLTDPLFNPWPGQYRYLISDILGGNFNDVGKSTIPGSPIWYRWSNPPGNGDPDARHNIANWELLSITERVPLYYEGGNAQQWYLDGIQEQKTYLSLFVNNAWTNGNNGSGAPTLLWTTWTNIDDSNGPWRPMLNTLGAEWERMQDYANLNKPSGAPPVYIIPGHRMMARLYDDIQLGLVPEITNIAQFFSDNIHLNELGNYAISLIHYACIFNKNPLGLPHDLIYNPSTTPPSPALATYLQTMIWDVVTNYPRTGIYLPITHKTWMVNSQDETGTNALRNVLKSALHGDTIRFESALNNKTITIADTIYINKSIYLKSNLAHNLTISPSASVQSVFVIAPNVDVTIDGLTINGGIGPIGSAVKNLGILTLKNVRLDKNGAVGPVSTLHNSGKISVSENCIISN